MVHVPSRSIRNDLLSDIWMTLYALSVACGQSLSSLFSLMIAYQKRLITLCDQNSLIDAIPDLVNALKESFINLLLFSAVHCRNALLSEEVFMALLAAFDHDKTHKEAREHFQTFLYDRNTLILSADTKRVKTESCNVHILCLFYESLQNVRYLKGLVARQAAYVAVMRNAKTANRDGFESL
ncbi:hypothetical protein QQP08_018887, partial [Theobroma cacao]